MNQYAYFVVFLSFISFSLQEKARLLGSGYDATLFHLAFRPFNLDSGAVDQATVMDDNTCMSEYSNSLSGSLLFFKPIEQ